MLDRKNQIESLIQKFHAIRHKMLTGSFILSPQNQIPNSQWIVLYSVYHNEGVGIKELSNTLGISSSAATQLVDNLVRKGHLVREESTEDRRALKINLSKKTKEILEVKKAQGFNKVYAIFDVLTDDELQIFCDLSKKVAENLLEK
jgi:DNA-binding MarR family transcriptional regulator